MSRQRGLWTSSGGFSYVELVVTIALIGTITAFAVPWLTSFTLAQRTQGAARELVALLNQARQLAITRNTPFSIEVQTDPQNRLRFCSGTTTPCPGGAVWTGGPTDPSGWMGTANGDRIVLGPAITFNTLGAATTAGTLRVQNTQGSSCLDVVVSPSGRIRIAAAGACP